MKQLVDIVIAFKLVWIRVLLYITIPALTTFLAQTETWSGDTWDHTHIFLKWRLLGTSIIPGMVALASYIDSSFARAKDQLAKKRESDTQILIK